MTRKHFRAIAEAIKNMDLNDFERAAVANGIASALRPFNAEFDRAKFLEACGV